MHILVHTFLRTNFRKASLKLVNDDNYVALVLKSMLGHLISSASLLLWQHPKNLLFLAFIFVLHIFQNYSANTFVG